MLLCSIRKLCDTLAIRAHGEVWRGLLCTQYDGCIGAKARGHRSHNLAHTLETMSPRLYVCEVALHDVDGIQILAKYELSLLVGADNGGYLKVRVCTKPLHETATCPSRATHDKHVFSWHRRPLYRLTRTHSLQATHATLGTLVGLLTPLAFGIIVRPTAL